MTSGRIEEKHNDHPTSDSGYPAEEAFPLWEHFIELRKRLFRVFVYVVLATAITWIFYLDIFKLLSQPIMPTLTATGSKFLITGIAEGFIIKFKISFIAGLIVAFPAIMIEVWRFISPGLHQHEQRIVRQLLPLSILLFLVGVGVAYAILPVGVQWLVGQNPPEAMMMPSLAGAISFVVGMLLACGILFQYPLVLAGLAKFGLVNSRLLLTRWREAIMVTLIVAAVVTPSVDAISMFVIAVPLIGLYGFSLILVRRIEKKG